MHHGNKAKARSRPQQRLEDEITSVPSAAYRQHMIRNRRANANRSTSRAWAKGRPCVRRVNRVLGCDRHCWASPVRDNFQDPSCIGRNLAVLETHGPDDPHQSLTADRRAS